MDTRMYNDPKADSVPFLQRGINTMNLDSQFAIVKEKRGETHINVLYIFYGIPHSIAVYELAGSTRELVDALFVGAGKIQKNIPSWGSYTCQSAFDGKDRPEKEDEAQRILLEVAQTVTELVTNTEVPVVTRKAA